MLKWIHRWACISFLHISSTLSGSCDHLGIGIREWILLLWTSNPMLLVLPTGLGNLPGVLGLIGKTTRFGSRTIQKPNPQLLGGPNTDPYKITRGFHRVWLDPSVPIPSSAFRIFYLWLHSVILLVLTKDRCWYIFVIFELIGSL